MEKQQLYSQIREFMEDLNSRKVNFLTPSDWDYFLIRSARELANLEGSIYIIDKEYSVIKDEKFRNYCRDCPNLSRYKWHMINPSNVSITTFIPCVDYAELFNAETLTSCKYIDSGDLPSPEPPLSLEIDQSGQSVPADVWEDYCGECLNASDDIPLTEGDTVSFFTNMPCSEYGHIHKCEAQSIMYVNSQQPKTSNTLLHTRER